MCLSTCVGLRSNSGTFPREHYPSCLLRQGASFAWSSVSSLGWPASPRELRVFASQAPGLQACDTTQLGLFLLGSQGYHAGPCTLLTEPSPFGQILLLLGLSFSV